MIVGYVPSMSTPGASYEIRREVDRSLTCSCPAFRVRNRGGCKHVRIYVTAQRLAARCQSSGHPHASGICLPCLLALLSGAASKVAREYRPKKRRS